MAKRPEAIRDDGVISNKAVLGIHAESQRDMPGLWIIQTMGPSSGSRCSTSYRFAQQASMAERFDNRHRRPRMLKVVARGQMRIGRLHREAI
ncbi:hypothetical protein FHX59_001642 [Paraburkholderia silvatlantica]|uniref:Uncharacterized protein n=1 Tax=Paraburkholderia silvatlantica TaxID=321895 RepID=A0A2U1AKN8_9BURK|nr:hypothetical protein [Paraburkholderia silvatlantica]PVY36950.1 hypothetical protein C7411_102243 [Paraburkholderia silvatlantica]PXW41772.1 hypothetical protein C7413_102178 [Paraburkholderia silvatlantica]PYE26240.1 hypothetical protein C7410_103156 [Paraburkholderia silvatlantica]